MVQDVKDALNIIPGIVSQHVPIINRHKIKKMFFSFSVASYKMAAHFPPIIVNYQLKQFAFVCNQVKVKNSEDLL